MYMWRGVRFKSGRKLPDVYKVKETKYDSV